MDIFPISVSNLYHPIIILLKQVPVGCPLPLGPSAKPAAAAALTSATMGAVPSATSVLMGGNSETPLEGKFRAPCCGGLCSIGSP